MFFKKQTDYSQKQTSQHLASTNAEMVFNQKIATLENELQILKNIKVDLDNGCKAALEKTQTTTMKRNVYLNMQTAISLLGAKKFGDYFPYYDEPKYSLLAVWQTINNRQDLMPNRKNTMLLQFEMDYIGLLNKQINKTSEQIDDLKEKLKTLQTAAEQPSLAYPKK